MSDKIEVLTFDGLYDEKSEAVLHNILNRKRCWNHNFINGSLHFEKSVDEKTYYSITLESVASTFNPEWGTGYGGIRYCTKCKIIDCIHMWSTTETYIKRLSDFCYDSLSVSSCRICNRRISRGSCRVNEPSSAAWGLITGVASEMGRPAPGINSGYGSAWMCEFPVQVSQILKQSGELAAKEFVRETFNQGEIQMSF